MAVAFMGKDTVTGMFKGDLVIWSGGSASKSIPAHKGAVNALCNSLDG